ncbi:MAG: hypothetical protein ACFBSG_00995 [Leptolyngbyaceae cyanobacterium]
MAWKKAGLELASLKILTVHVTAATGFLLTVLARVAYRNGDGKKFAKGDRPDPDSRG